MTVTVGWICATANWRGFYFGMQILDTLFPDLKNKMKLYNSLR